MAAFRVQVISDLRGGHYSDQEWWQRVSAFRDERIVMERVEKMDSDNQERDGCKTDSVRDKTASVRWRGQQREGSRSRQRQRKGIKRRGEWGKRTGHHRGKFCVWFLLRYFWFHQYNSRILCISMSNRKRLRAGDTFRYWCRSRHQSVPVYVLWEKNVCLFQ